MVLADDHTQGHHEPSVHTGSVLMDKQPIHPPVSSSSTFDWDLEANVMPRSSRSQSLTDPRLLASTAFDRQLSATEIASAPTARAVAFAPTSADEASSYRRRMRRTQSADRLSLSLLQEELGYPRAKVHRGAASPHATRSTRASRRSRHSVTRVDENDTDNEAEHTVKPSRPAATSDARTCHSTDSEVHEEEDEDDRIEDQEEENFLDRRLASVTGYARDTDGITYYEIVVESTAHGPLSAYKVRRRYSEFRQLHKALARIMPTRPPKNQRGLDHTRMSVGGAGAYLTSSGYCHQGPDTDVGRVRPTSQSVDEVGFANKLARSRDLTTNTNANTWLPPLPDSGGLWSYFQRDTPKFLETRARTFHVIIMAAQQHPAARASRLLNKFLGPPPDSFASSNYVSLNRFAAPTLRFSVEIQERKEMAKTISLKRRQSIVGM